MITRRLVAIVVAVAVVPVLVTGARHLAARPVAPALALAPGVVRALGGGGLVVATGHGWTPAGLKGPVPAAGSCHFRRGAAGEPLPDPACTPGATDPAVTQADLRSTVCRPGGYTATVRPPAGLTEPVKRLVMAAYGLPWSQARYYELDHLVELNAGGASDIRNLWPEPAADAHLARRTAFISNDKDRVEAYTFHALCAGTVRLAQLQQAIARDWSTAVSTLRLPPIPPGYAG